MAKPQRHNTHILDTKAKKYLESKIPDEWVYDVPSNDYGIDYHVDICINNQVTGLNFSIQLKGHEKSSHQEYSKAVLKHTTISYYKVRLEPIMIVVYEDDTKQAYWSWLSDHDINLLKDQKEYTIKVPKINILAELDWNQVIDHVQTVFNNRTFIGDLDISKIHDNLELAAWKDYHDGNYEQAVYLFRELIEKGNTRFSVYQALSWSLYQIFHYAEALTLINELTAQQSTANLQQMKACMLAEYGMSTMDKGKIIQARDLFKKWLNPEASSLAHYNYANTLSALGNFEEAINQFQISLDKNPYFAECWKNLGTAYGSISDHQKEISCYQEALSIEPELIEALFSMGIALAKDFQQYQEALIYFERSFPLFKTTRLSYINGLYWVAECYKQVGKIDKAFYWLDYGLNFQGNNTFLLDFKTNLLAECWPQHPNLKDDAEAFFNYRLELSHHMLSLYYLIELKNWTLEEALPLLKEHHPIFHPLDLPILKAIQFDLEKSKTVLLNFDLLANYKQEHRVTRFINNLINDHYAIGPQFYELIDLVSAFAFSSFILCYRETESDLEPSGVALDVLIDYVPKLVPYLVEQEKEFDESSHDMVLFLIYNSLETIVYREIGAISGFLNFHLNMRKVDPLEYISDHSRALLTYNLLVAIHDFLDNSSND